jgi:hypothetical protein
MWWMILIGVFPRLTVFPTGSDLGILKCCHNDVLSKICPPVEPYYLSVVVIHLSKCSVNTHGGKIL